MPRRKITRTEWIRLYTAAYRLRDVVSLPSICDQVIEKAVLSGKVPVRGISPLSLVPERIEKQINVTMHVDVSLSLIEDRELGKELWHEVEVNWPDCLVHCETNLIPNWAGAPPIRKKTAPKTNKRTASKKLELKKRAHRRPALESAREAVTALYANGIFPDHERNKTVCKKVGDWLKDNGREPVSDDTILRAARRRK